MMEFGNSPEFNQLNDVKNQSDEETKEKSAHHFLNNDAYNGLSNELYVISEEDATSYRETNYSERDRQNSLAVI